MIKENYYKDKQGNIYCVCGVVESRAYYATDNLFTAVGEPLGSLSDESDLKYELLILDGEDIESDSWELEYTFDDPKDIMLYFNEKGIELDETLTKGEK